MQVTTSTLSNNSVNLCSLSDDHDDDDGGGDGGSDILGHCVGRNRTVSEVSDGHLDTGDEDVYHDYQTFPPYPDFTQLNSVRLTFIVIYSIVIVLSIVGNALVCITVYRNKKMHTAVNYYIVNLALCDLLVGAFVMPMKLLELTAPADWNMLNDASCTLMMYIQTVFVFSSVLTLVATCVERYFAIVHPLESRKHHSKSRAKRILLVVWITPCVVASPFLYPAKAFENSLYSDYGSMNRLTCFDSFNEEFRRSYYIFLFIFIYLLSLCFITGTCVRIFRALLLGMSFHRQGSLRRQESNRRKVAKMVIVVVFAYVVFWTPYFVLTIVTQCQTENFMQQGQFFFTMLCINFLAFANSCVNPFIYGAMSARFRHGYRSIFLILCCTLCPDWQRALSVIDSTIGDGQSVRTRQRGAGGLVGRSSSTCLNNPSYSDTPPCSSQDVNPIISTDSQVVAAVNTTTGHPSDSSYPQVGSHSICPVPDTDLSSSSVSNECNSKQFHSMKTSRSGIISIWPDISRSNNTGKTIGHHQKSKVTSSNTSMRSAWMTLTSYASTAKKRILKFIDKQQYNSLQDTRSVCGQQQKPSLESGDHQLDKTTTTTTTTTAHCHEFMSIPEKTNCVEINSNLHLIPFIELDPCGGGDIHVTRQQFQKRQRYLSTKGLTGLCQRHHHSYPNVCIDAQLSDAPHLSNRTFSSYHSKHMSYSMVAFHVKHLPSDISFPLRSNQMSSTV